MRRICQLPILILLAMVPLAAHAITLTSRETADRKLIVVEGDKQSERVIRAGEKIELCPASCVIRVPDGEDYEFDGPETVFMEEGLLALDTEGQGRPAR